LLQKARKIALPYCGKCFAMPGFRQGLTVWQTGGQTDLLRDTAPMAHNACRHAYVKRRCLYKVSYFARTLI